jgi:signal transduction histidine kinase
MLTSEAFVVEDTGPGVPQAVRSRLFEPFVRGSDDYSTGSGLGLSIVKRVAEHLGWTIRLDDTVHGGSRFTLGFAPPAVS